jgi:SpoVK/Ycf46/Vps4 family AAA+-type ATPase
MLAGKQDLKGVQMTDFSEELEHMLKARFPLIYVETHEEARVVAAIQSVCKDATRLRTPRTVSIWTSTDGLVNEDGSVVANSKGPIEALNISISTTEPTVYIFKDLHAWFGDGSRPADPMVIRRLRDIAHAFKNGSTPVTLIMVSAVLRLPADLDKEITILDFPLPTEPEILEVLNSIVDTNTADGRIANELTAVGKEKLAKAALGLTLNEAENSFARAMVNDGKLTDSDLETVLDEKKQTIKKSGILEFVSVEITLDEVGGLQNLKKWLSKRNNSWLAEAKEYGVPAPKGVLITGVPGCGKSLTAKAIASAWELPLLRMDIGKIFAGLVGSSEQNMRSAIKTAEAIAPCVLWIDEIEKGFAGNGGTGDSGTSSRVFGSFLTWMQEKDKPVFVIATANNIDRLPPEFLRKGRFDEIFFVDLPTSTERVSIWDLHLNKRIKSEQVRGDLVIDNTLFTELAALSADYSGAEIEQAVISALFDAFSERRTVTKNDLEKSISNMVPLSITQAEAISVIRDWANERAVAATSSEDSDDKSAKPKTIQKPVPTTAKNDGPARGGRMVDF